MRGESFLTNIMFWMFLIVLGIILIGLATGAFGGFGVQSPFPNFLE